LAPRRAGRMSRSDPLQKASKMLSNRSHPSFDEQSTALNANLKASPSAIATVLATSRAAMVSGTATLSPFAPANRQNRTISVTSSPDGSESIRDSASRGSRKELIDPLRSDLLEILGGFHYAPESLLRRLGVQRGLPQRRERQGTVQ